MMLVLLERFDRKACLAIIAAVGRLLQLGTESHGNGDAFWYAPYDVVARYIFGAVLAGFWC